MPQEPEHDPSYALPTDIRPLADRELVDSHSSVLDATTHPAYDIETDKAELRDLASLTKHAIMEAIQCLECNQSESSNVEDTDTEDDHTNSTNFESTANFALSEPDPGPVSRSTESSSELPTPITQEISPLITQPPKQTARMVHSDDFTSFQITPTD
ncbi:hypothetical protein BC629DRAFT_1591136 [Irpex lacteus]|nr:hypothetical protein BC629DRAFT_1591136 [Irpex lacteus]